LSINIWEFAGRWLLDSVPFLISTWCEDGLERAQATRPDVVLLELKGSSPDVNPVGEMCQALSGHPAGVIVLTSYAEDDEREMALQAGARRYMLKHIDTTRLLAEIEAVATELPDQDH